MKISHTGEHKSNLVWCVSQWKRRVSYKLSLSPLGIDSCFHLPFLVSTRTVAWVINYAHISYWTCIQRTETNIRREFACEVSFSRGLPLLNLNEINGCRQINFLDCFAQFGLISRHFQYVSTSFVHCHAFVSSFNKRLAELRMLRLIAILFLFFTCRAAAAVSWILQSLSMWKYCFRAIVNHIL